MKKQFIQIRIFLVCTLIIIFLNSCEKILATKKNSTTKPEVELSDKLPGSDDRNKLLRLNKDTVYILRKIFTREEGEQLIIDEGTLIKVRIVKGEDNAGIIIQPGGVIVVNGSAEHPVVFTSDTANTNTQIQRSWAGIVIHGRSIDNDKNTRKDPADFSGLLNYVRIENASLRLHAVGNRTMIENVMVSNAFRSETTNFTSAFHIYGGTFNARNLVSYGCGGSSDFYISGGYSGNMQSLLAYRTPLPGIKLNTSNKGWYGVYIENNTLHPATTLPLTFPVISNLTVIGPGADSRYDFLYAHSANQYSQSAALITTGNARFAIRNSLLLGFGAYGWYLGDSLTVKAVSEGEAVFTHSLTHSNVRDRSICKLPGMSSTWAENKFRNCLLLFKTNDASQKEQRTLVMEDIFDWHKKVPLPKNNSPLWKVADFNDGYFTDGFFHKANYIGAFGNENWLTGWTRFNTSSGDSTEE
jgi:hypothetical protein